jgi:hypothetical protein
MGAQDSLNFVGLQRGVDDPRESAEEGCCRDRCGDGETGGYLNNVKHIYQLLDVGGKGP